MVVLTGFQSIQPPHAIEQDSLNQWILGRHLASKATNPSEDREASDRYAKLFQRYAINSRQISARSFECPDVLGAPLNENSVYEVSAKRPEASSIGTRTRFFAEAATKVMQKFYPAEETNASHIVHVTCTGYRSPSPAQLLVAQKQWGEKVGITHAYHMGCYAAFPAIRIAEGLVAAAKINFPGAGSYQVDVVHTEMCGLHMNPAAQTPEQIVVQTLFADGHVKYSVRSEASQGLKVLALKEAVLSDSHQDMSWAPEEWGLQMNLSREVPEKIRSSIRPFFEKLAEQAGQKPEALLRDALFAIHPGGPKVIDAVQTALEISDLQAAYSRQILRERGNMSSATLPHVWERILKSDAPGGTKVVSFAFGPGLTVFGAVFEIL